MGLRTSFDVLSRIVERYESRGRSVRRVEVATREAGGECLCATMDVAVSLCSAVGGGTRPALPPRTATLTEGDRLQVEFSAADLLDLPPAATEAVSMATRAVGVTDEEVVLTVDLTVDPAAVDEGIDENDAPRDRGDDVAPDTAALEAVRDESLPPYEDTDYLRALYEACDTFSEMSRRIEMDVAAETVRRYMIEAGVHDPVSYATSTGDEGPSPDGDASAHPGDGGGDPTTDSDPDRNPGPTTDDRESLPDERLVADGVGLPEEVELSDVVEAVVDSVSVFEVQRKLDLDRRPTVELLRQLDLLDLVMHRVADGPNRGTSYEEVATRIRRCAAGEA
ncbi:hypothetical protein [Halomarina ordinaria]|uniref:Uncharacterized protein n=1 Tax=Halomarina ordinaria TaxID=3033939 RepID=A0ABD5UGT6_9EURY|nr:hypothetical protein [Halomarina sp. PSRA2]